PLSGFTWPITCRPGKATCAPVNPLRGQSVGSVTPGTWTRSAKPGRNPVAATIRSGLKVTVGPLGAVTLGATCTVSCSKRFTDPTTFTRPARISAAMGVYNVGVTWVFENCSDNEPIGNGT